MTVVNNNGTSRSNYRYGNLIKKPWASFKGSLYEPYYFGGIGPGFLNQAPTNTHAVGMRPCALSVGASGRDLVSLKSQSKFVAWSSTLSQSVLWSLGPKP